MATCKNKQMGAGLKSGIEGNLHAVRAIWPHSAGWEYDGTDAYGKDDLAELPPPSPPLVTQEDSATEAVPPLEVSGTQASAYPQHSVHIHILRMWTQELTLTRAPQGKRQIRALAPPYLILVTHLVRSAAKG